MALFRDNSDWVSICGLESYDLQMNREGNLRFVYEDRDYEYITFFKGILSEEKLVFLWTIYDMCRMLFDHDPTPSELEEDLFIRIAQLVDHGIDFEFINSEIQRKVFDNLGMDNSTGA